ncbi:MAG: AAA family ATPase, partial [Candidatus Marinamargulisbacteria bacterium]
MKKKIFVAATRQNDGKTTVSLGLFKALRERHPGIQYMKPVGQQYKIIDDKKIDKDAVLFQYAFNLNQQHLPMMSPIASPRGFTESYINTPDRSRLIDKITQANRVLGQQSDAILYEGTGHAGVGSVFDLSNAHVAHELNSPVILVSIGGIGKAIDEIMLNVSVFKQMNVPVMGVIINKVLPEKYDKINTVVQKGLARLGLDVLGVLPLNEDLTHPSIRSIVDELNPNILSLNDQNQHNII